MLTTRGLTFHSVEADAGWLNEAAGWGGGAVAVCSGRPSFFLHLSDRVCLAYDSLLLGPALPPDQPDVYSVLHPAVLRPTAIANSFVERGGVIEWKTHRHREERREGKSGRLPLRIPFLSQTQRDGVLLFHLTAKRHQQDHGPGQSLGSKASGGGTNIVAGMTSCMHMCADAERVLQMFQFADTKSLSDLSSPS